jgi:hypothetical protein
MAKKDYSIVRNQPVAEFYYKGDSHSHPVRRKVLIHSITSKLITGYEIREGNEVRSFKSAPIKSYRRDRIARVEQCGRRLKARTPKNQLKKTTFRRTSLLDLVKSGT